MCIYTANVYERAPPKPDFSIIIHSWPGLKYLCNFLVPTTMYVDVVLYREYKRASYTTLSGKKGKSNVMKKTRLVSAFYVVISFMNNLLRSKAGLIPQSRL